MAGTSSRQTEAMRDDPRTRVADRPGDRQPPDDSTRTGRDIVDDSPLVAGDSRAKSETAGKSVTVERAATREKVEHPPGEVRPEPRIDLWPDGGVEGLRDRWRELQLLFVDDPQAAVAGADAVLAETIETLSGSLQAARSDLSGWKDRREVDTEGLRLAVQRYRSVLDRVLAL